MARWQPTKAGPRGIRSLYHWAWHQFDRVGALTGGDSPTDPSEPVPPPTPGAHSHYLDNLVNVDTSGKADSDSLTYDASSGNWVPVRRDLDNLTNVDVSTKADRNSLTYDEPSGYWVPELRNRVHIQDTQPADGDSSVGDIWIVAGPSTETATF